MENKCEFCGKKFVRERSVVNHLCEKKRRYLQRDEKHVRLGFYTWQRFMKYNKFRGDRTYEKFMNSRLYTSFVRFGKHIIDIDAIEPECFIDFVLKNAVRIDDWTKDFVYEKYLRELAKREPADRAIERNILLMKQWSMETGENWLDFFEKVNTNLAVRWIRSGRISPWLLYHSERAKTLIERMSEYQLQLIESYVNPTFWKKKFAMKKDDVRFVKDICKQAGL